MRRASGKGVERVEFPIVAVLTTREAPSSMLARADLVAAMNHTLVAGSETITDGGSFHIVLDPQVARDVYAARPPANACRPTTRGRVGASWRAAG